MNTNHYRYLPTVHRIFNDYFCRQHRNEYSRNTIGLINIDPLKLYHLNLKEETETSPNSFLYQGLSTVKLVIEIL